MTIVAISFTCSNVTVPTVCRFGSEAPFLIFAYFANKTEAGGDLEHFGLKIFILAV